LEKNKIKLGNRPFRIPQRSEAKLFLMHFKMKIIRF
jgi:hypothetical protein